MNRFLENLVAALREELKEYGEMLALLDQQETLADPRTPDHEQCTVSIQGQFRTIAEVIRRREEQQRRLVAQLEIDDAADFPALVSRSPSEYRPLLQALFQENSRLLSRIQQRTANFKKPPGMLDVGR